MFTCDPNPLPLPHPRPLPATFRHTHGNVGDFCSFKGYGAGAHR